MSHFYQSQFPICALGPILGNAVMEHHHATRIPMELIGPMALGLAAATVHDLVDVQRPNCPPSPVSLFVAIVAGSGEGKDAGAAPFVKPLRDFQARAEEESRTSLDAYPVDRRAWQVEEKVLAQELEKTIREGTCREVAQANLAHHMAHRPNPPRSPKVVYEDATVPAITEALCTRWSSGVLYNMEGSATLNGRLGSDFAFWNARWGGEPIFLDRVADGRRSAKAPRAGILIGIQPEPFRRFLKRRGTEAHDSGFTARYLMVAPPSSKGYRFIDATPRATPCLEAYAARCTELLNQGVARTQAGRERTALHFTPQAAAYFVETYNRMQAQMAPGQRYSEISGQAAKAAENIARVAAVLHTFDGLDGDISWETIDRATALVYWHVDEFLRMFAGNNAASIAYQDTAVIEQVLWHVHSAGYSGIPRSELKYHCPPDMKPARIERGLRLLIQQGRAHSWKTKSTVHVSLVHATQPRLAQRA